MPTPRAIARSHPYEHYAKLGLSYEETHELELGNGVYGIVFRQGNDRAIKYPLTYKLEELDTSFTQLETDWASEANDMNPGSFREEIQVLQTVGNHPSIVTIFSLSEKDGIEMEYLPNGNLEDYINENPTPSMSRLLQWILEAAEGLQHVQSLSLIHISEPTRPY